jgi:hypothetical protein
MSVVKVPIFGGLVSNADPEDLKKEFTPQTHNFDTSTTGVLKRRDIATKVSQQTDRGFDSMFLFRNSKLVTGGGEEWLIYCNQRGIIYRMDRFYNDLLTDSYDDNVLNYNSNNNPPGNDFLYAIANQQTNVPKKITFQPFGDYVLVGLGHKFQPKIIQAVKSRVQFLGQYTKSSGVYIEDFHRKYPGQHALTSSVDTSYGELADGNYRYNFVPIYDGVNEAVIDDSKSQAVAVSGGNGQANASLTLTTNLVSSISAGTGIPCSLTGYKVYRAPVVGSAEPAFRAIKTINLLTPAGAVGTTVSSDTFVAGKHIIYSPEGFPTVAELVTIWNNKYTDENTNVAQWTNGTNDQWTYNIMIEGAQGDTYGNSNTAYTQVTDDKTGATYYIGGQMLRSEDSQVLSQHLNMENWAESTTGKDPDGKFLYVRQSEANMNGSNDDGNIDEDGYENSWTNITGKTVVLRFNRWTTNGSSYSADNDHEIYVGVLNSYMGKDKIYSHSGVFNRPNTHAGSTASLNYKDKTNATKNITEDIYLHDTKMVMFTLDNNGDPSADIDALTDDYSLPSQSTNFVTENTVDAFTVTGGDTTMTYDSSSKAVTIVYNDKGEADGSLPTVPHGTITDLRWLYSENHGGRMFVGNVRLDPDGLSEYYPDMINYSEAGMPAIIPIANYIRIRDPEGGGIQGLKSMGDSLVVFMEFGIYRLRVPSIDPSSYSVLESNEFIGCIAPNSIVKVESKVYFCSLNNIYSIDNAFTINAIGGAILDIWNKESEKDKTIAEYDPIKEVVLFRFGRVKPDLYEYNIRTGEWNKIQTQANVSSMAVGDSGYLHIGDNSFLDVTRSDGNDNDNDPPDGGDDADDEDEITYIDLFDNVFDSTATITSEQFTNTAFFGGVQYKSLTATAGSNILTGSSLTNLGVGMTIAGYGLPDAQTVLITGVDNSAGEVAISTNATASAPGGGATPTYEVSGHSNTAGTFFGLKSYHSGSDLFRYFLTETDFTNSNGKLSHGYFCDEDYIFLELISDNNIYESISSTRKLIVGNLLRLDPTEYNGSPQNFIFNRVFCENSSPPYNLQVRFFQDQLNGGLDVNYVYNSGDYQSIGNGIVPESHNQSIVALKWKNSSYTQQPIQKFNSSVGFFLFIPDVYNWRKWIDIKPDANSSQDDGENSSNFVLPSINVVNSSTSTADENGSGDSYEHFPYWSRLANHSTDFNSTGNTTTLITAMGSQSAKIARYMGTTQHNVHKFGNNVTYTFEFFHIYQLDENTTGSLQRYRPIKNTGNSAYSGEVAYAIIYRLVDISGQDEDYSGSVQSYYPENLLNTTNYGYDPLLEEQVELITYYPSNPIEPEQGIVPMAGWLEKGIEQ